MDDSANTAAGPVTHEVAVGEDQEGERLDVRVAAGVPGVSRSAAQRLIKADNVRVNHRRRPQGFRVRAGSGCRTGTTVWGARFGRERCAPSCWWPLMRTHGRGWSRRGGQTERSSYAWREEARKG